MGPDPQTSTSIGVHGIHAFPRPRADSSAATAGHSQLGRRARRARYKVTRSLPLPTLAGIGDLRSILPQLWQHLRCPDRRRNTGTTEIRKPFVTCTVRELRRWLLKLRAPASRWGLVAESVLLSGLRTVAQQPVEKLQGFRFQDRSGPWTVDNLVGYAEAPVSLSCANRSRISWNSYVARFQLRISGEMLEVWRTSVQQPVVTSVEKRRRGDAGKPLAREPMLLTAASRRAAELEQGLRARLEQRVCDLLPAALFTPSGAPEWTLIYLHGLSCSALDDYVDRPHYFCDGSVRLKVVVPTAPLRELSCFDEWWVETEAGNWQLEQMNAWYDYLSDHDGAREDTIDLDSLMAMRRALHSLIRLEAFELGGRADRVILGGKSQGCCTALDALLTYPQPLGGFIGIVGHVLNATPLEAGGPQSKTPLHFFHETKDRVVRWSWVKKGEQRLRDAGFRVLSQRLPDPENGGHHVDCVEGTWIRSALRSICGRSSTQPSAPEVAGGA